MSMTGVSFMVLRIPMIKHQEETYWFYTNKDYEKVINKLINDRNVIDFYIIN